MLPLPRCCFLPRRFYSAFLLLRLTLVRSFGGYTYFIFFPSYFPSASPTRLYFGAKSQVKPAKLAQTEPSRAEQHRAKPTIAIAIVCFTFAPPNTDTHAHTYSTLCGGSPMLPGTGTRPSARPFPPSVSPSPHGVSCFLSESPPPHATPTQAPDHSPNPNPLLALCLVVILLGFFLFVFFFLPSCLCLFLCACVSVYLCFPFCALLSALPATRFRNKL